MNVCNTCGIYDNNGIAILAERIFDNVRLELNRETANILLFEAIENATPLYASGMGTLKEAQSTLTVTPHTNSVDVCGEIRLEGNLIYLSSGVRFVSPCALLLPICLQMNPPSQSMWPTNLTVDYSFFIDSLNFTSTTSLTGTADAAAIAYITSKMPVCVASGGSIMFNAPSTRQVQNNSEFFSCDFYPRTVQSIER